MKFITITHLTILSAISLAAAVPLDKRDVFVPPVLAPNSDSIWIIGSNQTVTWDVSNPPKQITNQKAKIFLKKPDGRLDLAHPLAEGFDILLGAQTVIVPNVPPSSEYSIVVYGDSGNSGELFTITTADRANEALQEPLTMTDAA